MQIINGIDNKETRIKNHLTGLYYYILNYNDVNSSHSDILGLTSVIENVCYNPFIEKDDFSINSIVFDNKKYQDKNNTNDIMVHRIIGFNHKQKEIGSYNIRNEYNQINTSVESKTLLYPFRYFILTDYINPPLLIKPQLMETVDGKWIFKVNVSLSNESKYCLYPFKYKADIYGNVEGIINNNPLLYPVTSNQYSSWLVSQGNTVQANRELALMENDISLQQGNRSNNFNTVMGSINGILGSITGLLSGEYVGGISSGINSISSVFEGSMNRDFLNQNARFNEYQIETSYLARKNDYLNTPRGLKSIGNDSMFTLENSNKKIDLIEYGLKPQRLTRIQDYLFKYGYKVNEYAIPNFTSREYFNFIKTVNCNIDSEKIPHEHISEIEEIFNSGITFWHVEKGSQIKNYNVDNREV